MKRYISVLIIGLMLSLCFIVNTVSSETIETSSDYDLNYQNDIDSGAISIVVPKDIKRGDIIFMRGKPRPFIQEDERAHNRGRWGHVCLYAGKIAGKHYVWESCAYDVVPIRRHFDGVRLQPLSLLTEWAENFTFCYVVNATEEMREGAIAFARSQWAKGYQYPNEIKHPGGGGGANIYPDDSNDDNSDKWYCSELVWASYYNYNFKSKGYGNGICISNDSAAKIRPQGMAPNNIWSCDLVKAYPGQNPPDTPSKPLGLANVKIGQTCVYRTSSNDNDSKWLYYQWQWQYEGCLSLWTLTPRGPDKTSLKPHMWLKPGNYTVRVRAKDNGYHVSPWSEPLSVHVYTKSYFTFLPTTSILSKILHYCSMNRESIFKNILSDDFQI